MTRPASQIARSQERMIVNRGGDVPERERMEATLHEHAEEILGQLGNQTNVDLFEVSYPELMARPDDILHQLADFTQGGFEPSTAAKSAINPALFRNI
jgi:hypothetical protein